MKACFQGLLGEKMYKITERDVEDFLNQYKTEFKKKAKTK